MSKRLIYLIGFLWICAYSYSQDKQDLEKNKNKKLEEIKRINELLNNTVESKTKTINEVRIINKRIDLRNNLIKDIETQIQNTERKIIEKENVVVSLQRNLVQKKQEYEELIIVAYKNKSTYNKVMYIIAAKDVNEAYKRYFYLKSITDYRKKQALIIQEIKKVQEQKLLELTIAKQEKEVLLLQRREEYALLSNEKSEMNEIISDLSGKEKELRKQLKDKERVLATIENEIRKIIDRETSKSSGSLYDKLTPQEILVSKEFSKNKGHLPWPTNKGVVTSKFGLQNYPGLRGVKTNNNGIDITTIKDEEVKAVFEGEVTVIAAIPGGNFAIIIRHGQFFSVYQNVVKVRVKQGDKVKTNQKIGEIFAAGNERTGILHFEIRKEREKLNPEDWLAN